MWNKSSCFAKPFVCVGREAPDVGEAKASLGPVMKDTAVAPLCGVLILLQHPSEWHGNLGGYPTVSILWHGVGILGRGLAVHIIL